MTFIDQPGQNFGSNMGMTDPMNGWVPSNPYKMWDRSLGAYEMEHPAMFNPALQELQNSPGGGAGFPSAPSMSPAPTSGPAMKTSAADAPTQTPGFTQPDRSQEQPGAAPSAPASSPSMKTSTDPSTGIWQSSGTMGGQSFSTSGIGGDQVGGTIGGTAFEGGGGVPDPDQEDHGGMPGNDPSAVVDQLFGRLRNTYGITQPQGQQGFADGGALPDDQAPQAPQAPQGPQVNPKRAMAYLQGAGAAPPQQAMAMRREVDPQGQMTPGQRNMRAIAYAATKYGPEAGMAQLQHDRQKYNAYKAAALVALHRSKGVGNDRPQ